MSVTEHPMQALSNFLPEESFEHVVHYLHYYKVHLTVTRKRKTILGNYRHAGFNRNHQITVNGNLNKFEFLITLLHELAHLLTFEQFGNRVDVHGKEWKTTYSKLLINFVEKKIFPADIELALQKSIINPSATANGETELIKVLRKYNPHTKEGFTTVDQIEAGKLFATENGRIFRKGNQRRKRFECIEIKTGLTYLFSPVAEVKIL